MFETIDDITIAYKEDDVELVKELDKEVLTKGAWTTIMFKYQQWETSKETYSADKYTIRRYRKQYDQYSQKSKFNISSKDQARKMIEILNKWMDEDEE